MYQKKNIPAPFQSVPAKDISPTEMTILSAETKEKQETHQKNTGISPLAALLLLEHFSSKKQDGR